MSDHGFKVTAISTRMHEVLNAIRSFGRPATHQEVALKLETTSREIEDVVWELRKAGLRCQCTFGVNGHRSTGGDGEEYLAPPKGLKL